MTHSQYVRENWSDCLDFFARSQTSKEAINGLARFGGQAFPCKCYEIASRQYLSRELSDCLNYLLRVRH